MKKIIEDRHPPVPKEIRTGTGTGPGPAGLSRSQDRPFKPSPMPTMHFNKTKYWYILNNNIDKIFVKLIPRFDPNSFRPSENTNKDTKKKFMF